MVLFEDLIESYTLTILFKKNQICFLIYATKNPYIRKVSEILLTPSSTSHQCEGRMRQRSRNTDSLV
jgi:hypothetical protein